MVYAVRVKRVIKVRVERARVRGRRCLFSAPRTACFGLSVLRFPVKPGMTRRWDFVLLKKLKFCGFEEEILSLKFLSLL
jgi:hypothetical protein